MEGAGRIFAGEYSGARYARADLAGESPALITPGGMVCRLLFVAGTLTEKAIPGGETAFIIRIIEHFLKQLQRLKLSREKCDFEIDLVKVLQLSRLVDRKYLTAKPKFRTIAPVTLTTYKHRQRSTP